MTDIVPANERLDLSDSSDSTFSSQEDPADTLVRRLTPQSVKAKIRIPTAHIYGKEDALLCESLDLVKMCDDSLATTLMHHGGHDIPLEMETSKSIHGVIEKAIERSHMMS